MVIERRLIRDHVREELAKRILDGSLPTGTKLDELGLAAELGVSRTPVREALALLADEGVLQSHPGRGFTLPALTPDVVREVYPMISALESLAVRSSDLVDLAGLTPKLFDICRQMRRAESSPSVQHLDDVWHATLCSTYKNERLHTLLKSLKRQVHRYELTLFSDPTTVRASTAEHDAIAAALNDGEIDRAISLLGVNWTAGMDRLLTWMNHDAREPLAAP